MHLTLATAVVILVPPAAPITSLTLPSSPTEIVTNKSINQFTSTRATQEAVVVVQFNKTSQKGSEVAKADQIIDKRHGQEAL